MAEAVKVSTGDDVDLQRTCLRPSSQTLELDSSLPQLLNQETGYSRAVPSWRIGMLAQGLGCEIPIRLDMVIRLSMMSTCTPFMPLSCESSHIRDRLLQLTTHRGLFETIALDWWEKSWGGYFTTFNNFLGFGWEVMGMFNVVIEAHQQSWWTVKRADHILPLVANKSDFSLV